MSSSTAQLSSKNVEKIGAPSKLSKGHRAPTTPTELQKTQLELAELQRNHQKLLGDFYKQQMEIEELKKENLVLKKGKNEGLKAPTPEDLHKIHMEQMMVLNEMLEQQKLIDTNFALKRNLNDLKLRNWRFEEERAAFEKRLSSLSHQNLIYQKELAKLKEELQEKIAKTQHHDNFLLKVAPLPRKVPESPDGLRPLSLIIPENFSDCWDSVFMRESPSPPGWDWEQVHSR